MFTYFKAEDYVASSFLFLLLLSGSLNVSEGCLSATDGLHKTLIRIQRDHTAGIQTLTNSQIMLSHLGVHGILSPPSFLPFLALLCPRNPKSRGSVLRPHHISCPNFYQLWVVPQLPWPSRGQPVGAHSRLTTDSSCRRKSPATGNISEVHSLAGVGHFSKLPGKGNTDSCPWKEMQGGLTKSSVEMRGLI